MGKKSAVKMPESYDLQELLKYNTDLNRFDSVNPWGSQTWDQGDNGKWTMTQAISPDMQGVYDQQLAFINKGNTPREMPGPLRDSYQGLMDRRSQIWGARPGYSPDVPATSVPRGTMGPPEQASDPRAQLANALRTAGSGEGAPRWGRMANNVMDSADLYRTIRDKYRGK